jgi:hypothetical protein
VIGPSRSPGLALERRQDRLDRLELTWFMLTRTTSPAGGGFAISDGRSIEIYANPMTPLACSRAHWIDQQRA